jgi:hypothetical protein
MKVRNGFVSNSSSSSFVVIGVRLSHSKLVKLGWYDEDTGGETDKIPSGISIYYDEHDDGYLVGKMLCESDEQGLGCTDLTTDELSDIISDVNNKLNKPVKLMMGTRPT